ncbi:MAG: hypothetical protein AAF682_05105 [Planctomycetota bacterium]
MSSKSRKKTPRKGAPPSAASSSHEAASTNVPAAAPAAGAGAATADPEDGLLGEDVVHVPRGVSRLQYVFLIALLVFLLVVFMVPGAILATFGTGDRSDPDVLSYESPRGGTVVLSATEFQKKRNELADVLRIPGLEVLRFFVGVQGREPSNEEAARLLVLDELAQEAGMFVTDADLATFLEGVGATADVWRQITQRYGGASTVEANLKRVLGIRRYLDFVGQVARIPDTASIEERWVEEHEEVAYDYVEVAADGLVEDAKAEAPADDVLSTWFDGRPDFEKNALMTQPRFRATFAVFRDGETTPAAALLERFPEPEDADAEERAQEYYNLVFYSHFRRPDPPADEEPADEEPVDGEEASEGEASGEAEEEAAEPEDPPSPYLSFDETKETCLIEAPAYFALGAWREDVAQRLAAGEAVDFLGEAIELGLEPVVTPEPLDLQGLRELEGLGGTYLTSIVTRTEAGQVGATVTAEEDALVVAFVDEKLDAEMPPFEEIREDVLDRWAKDRSAELVVERLNELRAAFEAFEPAVDEDEDAVPAPEGDEGPADHRRASEDAFRTAVETAGYTVERRPWLDKSGSPTDDPDVSKPGHAFLSQQRAYAELEEGEVPEASLDRRRTSAFLVRVVGAREIDLAQMTPQIYNSYKLASTQNATTQVRAFLTGEGLDERYGIQWLFEEEEAAEEEEPAE